MIVRRVASALKRQDWGTVLVELVLVIAGVLIALQVDNLNDQKAERLEEKKYLQQLLVEFLIVQDTLEDHIASYASFRDAALELVAVSQSDVEVAPERLSELYETATAGRIPSGAPSALRELISAGKMGLIENRELRTLLMRAEFKADVVNRVFDLLRTALLDQAQYLRAHVDYAVVNTGTKGTGTGDNMPTLSLDIKGLQQDPRAVTSVKTYFDSQRNMLQLLNTYLALVEEVILTVETELKR